MWIKRQFSVHATKWFRLSRTNFEEFLQTWKALRFRCLAQECAWLRVVGRKRRGFVWLPVGVGKLQHDDGAPACLSFRCSVQSSWCWWSSRWHFPSSLKHGVGERPPDTHRWVDPWLNCDPLAHLKEWEQREGGSVACFAGVKFKPFQRTVIEFEWRRKAGG